MKNASSVLRTLIREMARADGLTSETAEYVRTFKRMIKGSQTWEDVQHAIHMMETLDDPAIYAAMGKWFGTRGVRKSRGIIDALNKKDMMHRPNLEPVKMLLKITRMQWQGPEGMSWGVSANMGGESDLSWVKGTHPINVHLLNRGEGGDLSVFGVGNLRQVNLVNDPCRDTEWLRRAENLEVFMAKDCPNLADLSGLLPIIGLRLVVVVKCPHITKEMLDEFYAAKPHTKPYGWDEQDY